MKDLNVRQESIKILEENTGSNHFDLGRSSFLLDTSSKAKKQKQNEPLGLHQDKKQRKQGRLGGTAVKRLPSAQGVIPALWDRAPHQAPLL